VQLRQRQLVLTADRGTIYDRVGRQLAADIPTCSVYVHPQKVKDKFGTAKQLADITGLNEQSILKLLMSKSKFVYISRELPVEVGDKVKEANLTAVGVIREPKRVHPAGSLAAHILGFTDVDGKGLEGIERSLNSELTGQDGYAIAEVDSYGRVIPETRRGSVPAVDGYDIVLTIDANLQHITEEALAKTFETYKPAGATAIVMDPHTGEILALANCPTYDPDNRKGVPAGAWRNRAVTDLYEPGSTLKLMTIAAGLEEGIPATEVVATCTNGGMQIGRRRVRCSLHAPYMAGHGGVDMYGIIKHSCNIGAATIALRLGPDKLYTYMKDFGFLDKPGSGMAGETVLGLASPDTWPAIKLANIGFGQGIAVSPLQMACAYSVIANGGELMKPQIVREIRTKDGRVVEAFQPKVVRRVVSEATAKQAIEMLIGCVDDGTGKSSKVNGYSIGGKTGSAQKASTTGRGYAPGKYVASFMGVVPARDPKLVICVVVDEPKGSHWGATVAAPVFQEIAEKAMWYLRVPPDMPLEQDESAPVGVTTGKVKVKVGAGHTG